MRERDEVLDALGRAGKRALVHLIQAAIESVKAVEAIIEEVGHMSADQQESSRSDATERIDIE